MDASEEEFAAFRKKVNRSLYIDNLSPVVTEAVLRSALEQFGNVISVEFIPNYTEPTDGSRAALVEMENPAQVKGIISDLANSPFMISGMPRPVRVRYAEMEMFDNRPRRPGRKIMCRWLNPEDSNFEVGKKIKQLVQKHSAEASFLRELQLAEQEKLSKQQEENLKSHYKKYELLDGAFGDGRVDRLAQVYNMRVSESERSW